MQARQTLAALLAGVESARRGARRRMSKGENPQALASSSASLAKRFVHGAGLLARLEAPPVAGAAQVVLARSMIAAGGAYSLLGKATRSRSPRAYRDARLRVEGAERALNRALENFALLGYAGRA